MADRRPDPACPACRAGIEPGQEYCLDCGRRLGPTRRPLHWPAASLALLALAAAGAAGAVVATSGDEEGALLALSPLQPAPAALEGLRPLIPWPGHDGFTIVLAAVPARRGLGPARAQALRARRSGLPEVGVLVSDRYPDLHPGYYLVFSGIYDSLEEAHSHLPRAAARFPGAYARRIAR